MMELLKYRNEEVIPVSLVVLHSMIMFYTEVGFKFALKYHLPDLNGKVGTEVDEEMILLLQALSYDEIIGLIGIGVTNISNAVLDIGNLYNTSVAALEDDDNIWELAEEFYWHFVIDNFPEEDGTYLDPEAENDSYELSLLMYIESLIRLVGAIMDLVTESEVDVDEVYLRFGNVEKWTDEFISEQCHSHTLRILYQLSRQLSEDLNDYTGFDDEYEDEPNDQDDLQAGSLD